MKLGTLKNDTRDGALCVVARDLKTATVAYDVAPTLQAALDDWDFCAPRLQTLYEQANANPQGSRWFEVDFAKFAAPLPRAYQWLDASAYLSHAERLRKARGAELDQGAARGADDVPGRLRRVPRPARRRRRRARGLGHRPRGRARGRPRRRADGREAREGRRARPPPHARERRQPARPRPGGAREGIRLPPLEDLDRVLAGRGDARRARARRGTGASSTCRSSCT